MSGVPYDDIEAVKELEDPDKVTEHIRDRTWRLLKIAEVWADEAVGPGQKEGSDLQPGAQVVVRRAGGPVYVVGLVRRQSRQDTIEHSSGAREPPAGSYLKKCSKCGEEIRLVKLEGGAWAPRAPDGYGQHDCKPREDGPG